MSALIDTIIKGEARIGYLVFGRKSLDGGGEFYCHDANTWVWKQGSNTVFYKVNQTSIYKSNDGHTYRLVSKNEAKRLLKAAKLYQNLIENKVYSSLLSLS